MLSAVRKKKIELRGGFALLIHSKHGPISAQALEESTNKLIDGRLLLLSTFFFSRDFSASGLTKLPPGIFDSLSTLRTL